MSDQPTDISRERSIASDPDLLQTKTERARENYRRWFESVTADRIIRLEYYDNREQSVQSADDLETIQGWLDYFRSAPIEEVYVRQWSVTEAQGFLQFSTPMEHGISGHILATYYGECYWSIGGSTALFRLALTEERYQALMDAMQSIAQDK